MITITCKDCGSTITFNEIDHSHPSRDTLCPTCKRILIKGKGDTYQPNEENK